MSPEEKESWINALNSAITRAKNRILDEVSGIQDEPQLPCLSLGGGLGLLGAALSWGHIHSLQQSSSLSQGERVSPSYTKQILQGKTTGQPQFSLLLGTQGVLRTPGRLTEAGQGEHSHTDSFSVKENPPGAGCAVLQD